ncbi:MAG TPA: hypothetical protein VGR15_08915, partial [Bacteroidota bacterium]|nr:hypothetical protein [Bacteroidota bacterium]
LTRQGIPAAITEAYPARVGFQAGFLVPVNSTATRDILIGGFLDYSSTGGRVHYADYSGEVRNDHILSAYSIGTTLSGRIRNLKPLTLDFGLGARLVISKFKNEFSSTIGTSTNNLVLDFSSTGVGFEPGIAPSVSIFGANLGATVSYMFYIPTRLNSDQFKDAYLTFNRGGEVTIDWSGPRLGVIVGYDL